MEGVFFKLVLIKSILGPRRVHLIQGHEELLKIFFATTIREMESLFYTQFTEKGLPFHHHKHRPNIEYYIMKYYIKD